MTPQPALVPTDGACSSDNIVPQRHTEHDNAERSQNPSNGHGRETDIADTVPTENRMEIDLADMESDLRAEPP